MREPSGISGTYQEASDLRRIIGAGPAYLTLDLDVLDVAYAPGVADPEVNGMTTRELFGYSTDSEG